MLPSSASADFFLAFQGAVHLDGTFFIPRRAGRPSGPSAQPRWQHAPGMLPETRGPSSPSADFSLAFSRCCPLGRHLFYSTAGGRPLGPPAQPRGQHAPACCPRRADPVLQALIFPLLFQGAVPLGSTFSFSVHRRKKYGLRAARRSLVKIRKFRYNQRHWKERRL